MAATAKALDMTDVKDGGSFNKGRVPSGDYLAKVVKVDDAKVKKGDNEGQDQWLFTIQLEQFKSRKYPYYCTLTPNQLWKVRNLCTAVGIVVPKKRVKIDPNKLLNRLIAVTMEDDEYEGKEQSVIAAVFPASELESTEPDLPDQEDDEEEEEAPAPPARKKAAPTPPPVDEDEEGDEEEEEETPPPAKKPAKKVAAKKKITDDELDELDLDDL